MALFTCLQKSKAPRANNLAQCHCCRDGAHALAPRTTQGWPQCSATSALPAQGCQVGGGSIKPFCGGTRGLGPTGCVFLGAPPKLDFGVPQEKKGRSNSCVLRPPTKRFSHNKNDRPNSCSARFAFLPLRPVFFLHLI